MLFEAYLEIVRSFFFPSFGEVSEALVSEFFGARVCVVQAAFLIGEGLPVECASENF